MQVTATNEDGTANSTVESILVPAIAPTVTTDSVTEIDATKATVNCNITKNGGSTIIKSGVCYGTVSNPTGWGANITEDGSLSGLYHSSLSGLTPNTTYYVKAYAINAVDTAYGAELSFTTPNQYTITFDANGGTGTMAPQQMSKKDKLHANAFTKANHVFYAWNTNAAGTGVNYVDKDSVEPTSDMTLYAQWESTCEVASLHSNEAGVGTRLDSVKDHQNNWYEVVQIGTQCWLKENMRCTTSPKGALNFGGSNESKFLAYYYYPEASPLPLRLSGLYYNWAGALDTNATANITASFEGRRGICPEGWHIPTDAEWTIMEQAALDQYQPGHPVADPALEELDLRAENTELAAILSGAGWTYSSKDGAPGKANDTYHNVSGFSIVSGGIVQANNLFEVNTACLYGTASSYSGTSMYSRILMSNELGVSRDNSMYKSYGASIRCIRD